MTQNAPVVTKFGRIYSLSVQGVRKAHTLAYPLTLDFTVERKMLASLNTARFVIYNLSEDTRRDIMHDPFPFPYKFVEFKAGYQTEKKLSVSFRGNITWAISYRQGPDWLTVIEAMDGGWAISTGQYSQTYPAGYTPRQVLNDAISSLKPYNVKLGKIGNIPNSPAPGGATYHGNCWEIVNQVARDSGGTAFIDQEVANVFTDDDVLPPSGPNLVIDSSHGLLNTPRRYQERLDVEMIFEPRVAIGQSVQLKDLLAYYNGVYRVAGVVHSGRMGGAIDGGATSIVSLWNKGIFKQVAA